MILLPSIGLTLTRGQPWDIFMDTLDGLAASPEPATTVIGGASILGSRFATSQQADQLIPSSKAKGRPATALLLYSYYLTGSPREQAAFASSYAYTNDPSSLTLT